MRPLFQAMIAEFKKPGASFTMKQQCVEGDYAYIVWTAESADNMYELATHIRCAGRQDRGPVIHRKDYAQALKHGFTP